MLLPGVCTLYSQRATPCSPPRVADANTAVSGGAPRTPAFNTSGAGKHWVISELEPLSAGMAAGVDHIYKQRIRSLLSVDDIIADVVALVTAAGRLDDTYFFYTSDHGYNLGVSQVLEWQRREGRT